MLKPVAAHLLSPGQRALAACLADIRACGERTRGHGADTEAITEIMRFYFFPFPPFSRRFVSQGLAIT